ncbi:MAG: hypothetical protein QHH06_03355 [Clostridiales bacterium]|nr:hypothetical protein [Eubacteriales bacterium]MDH7565503.1 hypothetical protein [Clostridiales bacterium]
MSAQLIILLCTLVVFVGLGFAMSRSIKKYDERQKSSKKNKGRNRYLPEAKRPGR